MSEIITERNYPIEGLWIFKSVFGYIAALLISAYLLILFATKYGARIPVILYIITPVFFFHLITNILRRATFHYAVEDKFLTLRQGILSKQQRHIPYGVIQNIFLKQDLLDRVFGLASLTIENASRGGGNLMFAPSKKFRWYFATRKKEPEMMPGFIGNKVDIPGLTKQNAEILKGIILQKMKENPIEDSQSGL